AWRAVPRIRSVPGGVGGIRGAEQLVPSRGPVDRAGEGIEQQLARVEALAARGIPRTVGAVAVAAPRAHPGPVGAPHAVRAALEGDALDLAAAEVIEEAQLDGARVLGPHREACAVAVPAGALRRRRAGRDRDRRGIAHRSRLPFPGIPRRRTMSDLRARLYGLSQNLWWSWSYELQSVFRAIDGELWREVNHNPIA